MSRYTIEYSRERGPQGASGSTDASAITSGTLNAARLPATVVQTTGTYANPAWITELASTKITGTLTKLQQHAQTAYYDAAGTWAETQLFQKPITVQDGAGNNVFDVITNQIRFRSASAGLLFGPSGQCLAGEDSGGFYLAGGFTTPTKAIYIGQQLTTQIIAAAQTINNRTSEFNIIGVDGTGLGAFRAGVSTFGTGTAYGQLNVYGGATYIAQDQPINWHSGGTVRSQIIGDSTDNLRFSTRKAGVLTEAFVLEGSGAATFNGAIGIGGAATDNFALDVSGANGIRTRGTTGGITLNGRSSGTNATLYADADLFRIYGNGADRFVMNLISGASVFKGGLSIQPNGGGPTIPPADGVLGIAGAESGIRFQDRDAADTDAFSFVYSNAGVFRIYRGVDRLLVSASGVRVADDLVVAGKLNVGSATLPSAKLDVTDGYLRVNSGAGNPPASGKGLECTFDAVGNVGFILAYNRDSSTNYPLHLGADALRLAADKTATFNGLINANNVGANVRLKADGSDALDGGVFANGLGTIYLSNWNADRGIRINADGSIATIGTGSTTFNGLVACDTATYPQFALKLSGVSKGVLWYDSVNSRMTLGSGSTSNGMSLDASGNATFWRNTIVGSGTSSPIVRINGGSTIGIGASIEFQAAGSTIGYVGRASYVSSGGINTSDMAYYAHTGLGHNFIVNGGFSSAFSVTSAGNITATGTAKLGDFTVATLPSAASNTGHECNVTDSSVTTFGATVAGGGSNNVKVRSNGTNWTVTGI